jgi:hypothetical protein
MEKISLLFFLVLASACVMKAQAEILSTYYYQELCPIAEEIVKQHVEIEVYQDPNVAAQLLRLHFHDCFVMVKTSFFFVLFVLLLTYLNTTKLRLN